MGPCATSTRLNALDSSFSPDRYRLACLRACRGGGFPVDIAGLEIESGDLMHGDRHGIAEILDEIAEKLIQIADRVRARLMMIVDFCQRQNFAERAP